MKASERIKDRAAELRETGYAPTSASFQALLEYLDAVEAESRRGPPDPGPSQELQKLKADLRVVVDGFRRAAIGCYLKGAARTLEDCANAVELVLGRYP